jgi:hypothetical protein
MKDILIVGNGTTTRANVEALIDDYFYAHPKLSMYVAVYDGPSEGQVWAIQYADEKGKDIVAIATNNAKTFGVPNKYLHETREESPLRAILQSSDDIDMFILWDDEDPICRDALAIATEFNVTAYDLTNGLFEIHPAVDLQESVKPDIPVQETVEVVAEIDMNKGLDEYADENDEPLELNNAIQSAIKSLAAVIAEQLALEIVKELHGKVVK